MPLAAIRQALIPGRFLMARGLAGPAENAAAETQYRPRLEQRVRRFNTKTRVLAQFRGWFSSKRRRHWDG
jgi:hypothetical protein